MKTAPWPLSLLFAAVAVPALADFAAGLAAYQKATM